MKTFLTVIAIPLFLIAVFTGLMWKIVVIGINRIDAAFDRLFDI